MNGLDWRLRGIAARGALALLALPGCNPDTSAQGDGDMPGPTSSGDSTSTTGSSTSTTGTTSTTTLDGSSSDTADGGSSTGDPPPPELLVHFGTFSASSTKGMQAVTGVGFEPHAVLLWITEHQAAGLIDQGHFGRGWTDGLHDGAVATAWADGETATRSRWVDDACITLVNVQGDVVAEASTASLDADGFSLEWITPGNERQVAYLALGGSVEAAVGNLVLTSPTETVDTVGFLPEAILLAGVEELPAPSTGSRGGHGFGVAVPGDASHGSAHRERSGGSGDGSSGLSSDVALVTANDVPPPSGIYSLSGVDLEGFALTHRTGVQPIGTTWLALRGLRARAGVLTQPAAAGDMVVEVGFESKVVLFDGGDAIDWQAVPEIVHGVAVGTAPQAALWQGRSSGALTEAVWDSQRALLSHDVGTRGALGEAAVSAVDGAGFTLQWTTTDGVGRHVGWLALGSPAPG
ncbi:MAG: hypothetical protein KDK70_04330 [Myxococcales bacterium]|nr:hypothetical protein [Myxococcales bacterium]